MTEVDWDHAKEVDKAYWDQTEHPDLVNRTCTICMAIHLNGLIAHPAVCPSCRQDKNGA